MIRAKRSFWLICAPIITIIVFLVGGCSMLNSSQTEPYPLTHTQQNNIAMGIKRKYDIKSITFRDCYRHKVSGSVHIIVEINGSSGLRDDIPTLDLKNLDDAHAQIGLSPVEKFSFLEREKPIAKEHTVDLSTIKIQYLGE